MSAKSSVSRGILYSIGLTLWVVLALILGQTIAALGVFEVLALSINSSSQNAIAAGLGYASALLLAIGVPALIWKKSRVTRQVLGMDRGLAWKDFGAALLAIIPYLLLSSFVIWVGMDLLKIIDPSVGQELGFDTPTQRIEFIMAFLTLVIMAPVAEEILFRGYFLGRMSQRLNKWVAVVLTSIVFGALHLVGGGESGAIVLQWGAAADTFAMGLVVGGLRVLTGSIWAGVLLHGLKNAVAYYFLFVNPLPPGSM